MQGGLQALAGVGQVYEVIDAGIQEGSRRVVPAWNLSIEKVVQASSNEVLRIAALQPQRKASPLF